MINDKNHIESGESQTIISNSMSMISQMTYQPRYINDQIVSSSISILKTIQTCDKILNKLLSSDNSFKNDFANAISNMLKYVSAKQSSLNGRMLSDS